MPEMDVKGKSKFFSKEIRDSNPVPDTFYKKSVFHVLFGYF